MYELDVGPRAEVFAGVAQGSLECRVHALEVPVEAGDGDQVGGEGEDPVELGLGAGSPPGVESERSREPGKDEPRGEDDPRQSLGGPLERLLRNEDLEPLSGLPKRLADRFAAAWSRRPGRA